MDTSNSEIVSGRMGAGSDNPAEQERIKLKIWDLTQMVEPDFMLNEGILAPAVHQGFCPFDNVNFVHEDEQLFIDYVS